MEGMRTGWPGPFAEETNERTVCSGKPQGRMHDTGTSKALLFTSIYENLPTLNLIVTAFIFQWWPKRNRFS